MCRIESSIAIRSPSGTSCWPAGRGTRRGCLLEAFRGQWSLVQYNRRTQMNVEISVNGKKTKADFAPQTPNWTAGEVRCWLEGNICPCTGYQNIVASVLAGAAAMQSRAGVSS